MTKNIVLRIMTASFFFNPTKFLFSLSQAYTFASASIVSNGRRIRLVIREQQTLLRKHQHGFCKRETCLANLLDFDSVSEYLRRGNVLYIFDKLLQ